MSYILLNNLMQFIKSKNPRLYTEKLYKKNLSALKENNIYFPEDSRLNHDIDYINEKAITQKKNYSYLQGFFHTSLVLDETLNYRINYDDYEYIVTKTITIPLCKDCKYFQSNINKVLSKSNSFHKCKKFEESIVVNDQIAYNYKYAAECRRDNRLCGIEGRYFKKKTFLELF